MIYFLVYDYLFNRVTALDSTAFITRIYREKNQTGFLKAFTDEPEQITYGMSPLKNILKELQVRVTFFRYVILNSWSVSDTHCSYISSVSVTSANIQMN